MKPIGGVSARLLRPAAAARPALAAAAAREKRAEPSPIWCRAVKDNDFHKNRRDSTRHRQRERYKTQTKSGTTIEEREEMSSLLQSCCCSLGRTCSEETHCME
jgi:hypothetical protein